VIGLCFTSCGSILQGRNQVIPVSSSPAGAHIYVDGQLSGFTPTLVEVDRRCSHVITLAREGYEAEYVNMHPHMSYAVLGNVAEGVAAGVIALAGVVCTWGAIGMPAIVGSVLAGTAVGTAADMMIGGAYCMSKNSVSIPLKPNYYHSPCSDTHVMN
jgi:hypothetical protein